MRRFGIGRFDAFCFEIFDGLRQTAKLGLNFFEGSRLFGDDIVELLHLPLQFGDVRFQPLNAFSVVFHITEGRIDDAA